MSFNYAFALVFVSLLSSSRFFLVFLPFFLLFLALSLSFRFSHSPVLLHFSFSFLSFLFSFFFSCFFFIYLSVICLFATFPYFFSFRCFPLDLFLSIFLSCTPSLNSCLPPFLPNPSPCTSPGLFLFSLFIFLPCLPPLLPRLVHLLCFSCSPSSYSSSHLGLSFCSFLLLFLSITHFFLSYLRCTRGPRRIFVFRAKLQFLSVYSADQSEYLKIKHLDGRIEHRQGPQREFCNPLLYQRIDCCKAMSLTSHQVRMDG